MLKAIVCSASPARGVCELSYVFAPVETISGLISNIGFLLFSQLADDIAEAVVVLHFALPLPYGNATDLGVARQQSFNQEGRS